MITTLIICIAFSLALGIGYGVGRVDSIRIENEKREKMREAAYKLLKGFEAFEQRQDEIANPSLPPKRKRGRPRKNPVYNS